MVATRRQTFQFVGAGSLESPLFGNILGNNQNRRLIELPGEVPESQLTFFAPCVVTPLSLQSDAFCVHDTSIPPRFFPVTTPLISVL